MTTSQAFTYGAVSGVATLLDSTGSSGDASGADLKNLTNNSYAMAPAITPTVTGPELWGAYVLLGKFGSAPSSGILAAKCWFVNAQDNTNYETISGTNIPTAQPDFVFYWPSVSSAGPQRLQSSPRLVQRPPWKHKILVQNVAGQTTTNVNNDNQLLGVTVSELGTGP